MGARLEDGWGCACSLVSPLKANITKTHTIAVESLESGAREDWTLDTLVGCTGGGWDF
jgi:hypothetical protein